MNVAVIVAAGRGSRAGEGLPKQYRSLGGEPVLRRTMRAFLVHPRIDRVVCAIHPDDAELYADAVGTAAAKKLLPAVAGGASRQLSVLNALRSLADGPEAISLCLIHDAARAFVDARTIDEALDAADRYGAAVPGVAVTDTIKRIDGDDLVVETVDRATLRAVQTPQAFRFGEIRSAHEQAAAAGLDTFTDDASLAEWAGLATHVFEGDPVNTKLTRAEDFEAAERRLGSTAAPLITKLATGFDVHVFGPGDHVWLGGVRVPHDRGVVAHSDGDVVLHALTDALLGVLSEGDIGTHFPPSDPQWKAASSDQFLAFAAERIRQAGGRIDHLDATILCERPKVGPYRDAMRARIAAIAGIAERSVSIKATTTEQLGFTGRGEGLAAQAAATVRLPDAP